MIREMTFDKNELSLHHQAKGLVYTMMDHEHHENANLPVNLNLLTYNDKALTRKLTQSLFTAPYTHSASPEFKSNIILFSIFQISFLVVSIIVTSLEYAANQKSRKVFMLKITLLAVLSCCTFLALTAMAKSSKFLLKSREVLSWLSIAMVIYMSICDERVLSGMIGQDFSSSGQYTITIIGLYIAAVRHALMDSFKNLAILSGVALASALATTLAFSAVPLTSGLSDFFILLAFLVIVLMDTYQNDLRIKQLFWRKEKEKEYSAGTEDLEHEDNLLNNIKTEIEIIIQSFDKIKKNLKNVCAVIMYKDVKNKLKLAINEIDRVKRRLAHGTFTNVFKLEHHPGISENDKLFIVENFADPNHTALKRCSKIKQSRLTESPLWSNQGTEIEVLLGGIGNMWNFDIWFVYQTTGYSVYLAAKYMMKKWLLAETLNIEYSVSENYFLTLEKAYKANPYHNACHAADVMHSIIYFYCNSEIIKALNPLELLGSIIAGLGHDVGHPSLTNKFLVNNRDEIAITYNDKSVLENMHTAKTFEIMARADCNILENLIDEDWVSIRKTIVSMILDTDMSRHFELLGKFRSRTNAIGDINLEKPEDKETIMSMAIKCADIGHSAKIVELHEKWTALICEEFFHQGDLEKERGQVVSMYCDRKNTDIPMSQVGFIKNICLPLYETWCNFLKSENVYKNCLEQLKINMRFWEDKGKKM